MKASSLHGWLMVAWGVLLIPTILWWRDSVVWVVAMSWYAIMASHWSCREASKADEAVKDA